MKTVSCADGGDADPYYAYGTFLMKYQSNDRDSRLMAQRFLTRAVEIDPAHVLALDELAAIYEAQGDLETAEKLWVQALDVDPKLAPSHADFVALLERVRSSRPAAAQ